MSSFVEICNLDVAKKLSTMSLTNYIDLVGDVGCTDDDENIKSSFTKIKTYCNEIVKSKKINVNYKFGKNDTEGRLYADGLSLQGIKKEFRGVLCDGIYLDLDQDNSHLVILKYLTEKKDIECYSLYKYCNSRDSILDSLCEDDNLTKSQAKVLFIKSINTEYKIDKNPYADAKKKPKIKNKFFLDFDKEIKSIMPKLIKVFPNEYKIIRNREKDNIKGKFISYICRKYESIILNLVTKEFPADVLMFDGFMIKKDKIDDIDSTIKKLNEITKEYNIKWTNKEHDTSLFYDILDLEVLPDDTSINVIEDSLKKIAEYLFDNIYNKRLIMCSGNLWFKSDTGWTNNPKKIEKCIMNQLFDFKLYKNTEKGVCLIHALSDYKEIYSFISTKSVENDKLLDEIRIFCMGKLFFKNGYYDIKINKFIESNDFNTLKRIEKDFIEEDIHDNINFIYEKVLNPMFTCENNKTREQLRDNFLYNMSRSLFGFYQDKNWFTMDGPRDCGKGMLCELIQKTFENYTGAMNGENLLFSKGDSKDQAKARSFLLDLIGKRLVLCNEMSVDKGSYIDGNKIKSFCSGGDTIIARKNFQDEQYFVLECGLMILVNDLVEIKPADAKEHQTAYYMNSKFLTPEDYEIKKPTEGKVFKYYKRDEYLKNQMSEEKIQMAFIHIIINSFNKGSISYPKELLKQIETDSVDDYKTFYDLFEFNSSSNLLLKDIVEKCNMEGLLFQMKKIKQLLIDKGMTFAKTSKGQTCFNISFKKLDFEDSDDED